VKLRHETINCRGDPKVLVAEFRGNTTFLKPFRNLYVDTVHKGANPFEIRILRRDQSVDPFTAYPSLGRHLSMSAPGHLR
jgi:hypothetical protein